jgi:hypothetical protein
MCACNSKPKGVLSEDKMAALLVDLKVGEAYVDNIYVRSIDTSKVIYDHLQDSILKKHQIDTSIFNLSYNYYLSDKKTMLRIFEKSEKIIEALDEKENQLNLDSTNNEKPSNNSNLQRERKY